MPNFRAPLGAIVALILLSEPAFAATDSYSYDALGRVVTVIHANGSVTSYSYDPAGNRKALATVPYTAVLWGSFNWNNATWHN